jgi:adenosylcobinamide-GDP ribazoletransferase
VKPTELVTAFALLTRLPMPRAVEVNVARCVWAFPIVGLVVNGMAAGVYWLLRSAGAPSWIAACWAVGVLLLLTGALHEDGLADTADGFGGGTTRDRKLEIMRDSRIGTYGALAVLLALMIRVGAIVALNTPARVAEGLIAAGMLSRAGILLVPLLRPPARNDGLGFSMAQARPGGVGLGLALSIAGTALCLSASAAMTAIPLAFGSTLALALLSGRQIGGYTGDVLGAAAVVTECVALSVATGFGA